MWRKKTLNDDDNSVSTAATVTTAVILEETSATATNQVHFELHPIHSMAAEWRHAELENVFTRHPHRYPIELAGHSGYERSLGALFDYPLHACVIALRKKLTEFKQTRKSDIFNQATGSASSLISTLRTLLNHGLEPNERLEHVNGDTKCASEMNEMTGFTPVEILAGAAIDILSDRRGSKGKGLLEFATSYVERSVEILIQHGAHISSSMDPPPLARPNRRNPSSKLPNDDSSGSGGIIDLSVIDRGRMWNSYSETMVVFGGEDKLRRLQSKSDQKDGAKAPSDCTIPSGNTFPSSILDSQLSGGSDSNNCAICWRKFGFLRNQRHICKSSRRYVCEVCSSKMVITMEAGGDCQSHRVSDGQFNYLMFCVEREKEQDHSTYQDRDVERKQRIEKLQAASYNNQEQMNERRQRIEKLQAARYNNHSNVTETEQREELFSLQTMGRTFINFFTNECGSIENTEDKFTKKFVQSNNTGADKWAKDRLLQLKSSSNQTKNAFNERGERLNAVGEKTLALKDACRNYSNMAQNLKKKKTSRGWW